MLRGRAQRGVVGRAADHLGDEARRRLLAVIGERRREQRAADRGQLRAGEAGGRLREREVVLGR